MWIEHFDAGLLGLDLLRNRILTLDFRRGALTLVG